MPVFQVTDSETGRKLKLTGNSPPTEDELTEIFSQFDKPRGIDFPLVGRVGPQSIEESAQNLGIDPNSQTLGQDLQQAISPSATTERALIGAGRGFTDVAEGVQQAGLEAQGLITGLGQPNPQLQQFTQQAQQERQVFEETPVGQRTASQAGRLAGNIAPFLAVPGTPATLPARIGTGAGIGTGIGATTFINEGESRKDKIFQGLAFGTLLPIGTEAGSRVLGKIVNAATGKLKNKTAQEIVELGAKEDVPVFAPDAGGPTSKKLSTLLEEIPLIGMRGPRQAQMGKAQAAAQGKVDDLKTQMLTTEFGGKTGITRLQESANSGNKASQELLNDISTAGDDWNRIIKASGNLKAFRVKSISNKKFNKVSELADPRGSVDNRNTLSVIDEQIEKEANRISPDASMINELNRHKERLSSSEFTFSQVRDFRTDVSETVSSFYTGNNLITGSRGVGAFQAMKKSLDRDLESFAATHGKDLQIAWREADSFFKKNVVPFKDDQLARALKNTDPDEIFGKFITRDKGDRALRFHNNLGDEGRAAIRYGMVSNAMKKALDEERGIFSPAKFAREMIRLEDAGKAFFRGQARQEMNGFIKLMRHVERSGQVFENPPTANRFGQLIVGGSIGGGIGVATAFDAGASAVTATTIAAANISLIRYLFVRKSGRDFLLSSSKLEVGSPAMEKMMNQISESLRKAGVVILIESNSTQETQESPR